MTPDLTTAILGAARTTDRAERHALVDLLADTLAELLSGAPGQDFPMPPARRQQILDDLAALQYIAARQADGPPPGGYYPLRDLPARTDWADSGDAEGTP